MMNGKPLMFDFFCGLGGASNGFLAEGWECVGVDVERHYYGTGGYRGHLIIQDILTFHGSQAKDAEFLWFSPPCQAYSYMAMPWTRAKKIAAEYRDGTRSVSKLKELFNACFRIQIEASHAARRYIPMVVENVRGAQPWVGRSRWHYGSFHLWGDVPALMPITRGPLKGGDRNKNRAEGHAWTASFADTLETKNSGGSWFNIAHNTESGTGQNPDGRKVPGFRFDGSGRSFQSESVKTVGHVNIRDGYRVTQDLTNQAESDGVKGFTPDGQPLGKNELGRYGSKSPQRKAASAMIAKIPLPLAQWIARVYKP